MKGEGFIMKKKPERERESMDAMNQRSDLPKKLIRVWLSFQFERTKL